MTWRISRSSRRSSAGLSVSEPWFTRLGAPFGFLAHTADGGLMDPDGGNGEITPEDVTFSQSLYSLAPGTFVGLGEHPRIALARSGRRSVTIVDPVRR